MVAIRGDGVIKGSVSGGCIEDDLIRRVANGELIEACPRKVIYGVSADEAHRFGLPCGGTMHLVIERLSRDSKFDALLAMTQEGAVVCRELDLASGGVTMRPGTASEELTFDGKTLLTVHGPQHRLVIIGAGHLSEYVAQIALMLGYRVIVCDPREEYTCEWSVPQTEISQEMPDDLLIRIGVDQNTAVVALTHDPKLDDMALIEALKSNAFYVGAIGSRANNSKRRARLREFDLGEAQIATLKGPVGLHIGAQTPQEIAVSILAEMTATRRHVLVVPGQPTSKSVS